MTPSTRPPENPVSPPTSAPPIALQNEALRGISGEAVTTTPSRPKTCARCGDSLRPSRRRFFDMPMSWLGFKPYRCQGCSKRNYRRR